MHYEITVELIAAGNIHPDSRHLFLAQVNSDEALRARASQGRRSEDMSVSDREGFIKAAVKDGVCEFLERRNILVFGLAATADTRRAIVAGAGVPGAHLDTAPIMGR